MKRMGRRERKRRVFALIISAVVLCFLAAGCSLPQSGDSEASGRSNSSETVQEKNAGQVQRTVFAMNTMMNLRAFGENAEAAIEAADIVLMDDNPAKIAGVVKIGRKTMAIAHQNIVFALAVKAVVLLMGAAGVANMWEAVFADVGVSVIAILNAMRALRTK